MPRKPRQCFPNIEAVHDHRTGALRGWRATVWVSGRAKWGKTREDQQQSFDDAQELVRIRERIDDEDPNPTLKTAMGRVESTLDVQGRRPSTKEWYMEKFEQLKDEFGENTLLRDVTRQKLQVWINRRLKTDKVSPNTVHHVLRAPRRLFSVCDLPSPTRDSRLVVPDQVPSNHKISSWAEVVKKLEAIKKVDIVQWGWLVLVAYTGIRRSEVAQLKTADLDLDEEVLHVRHAKVAKQPRTLPMPKGLVTVAGCGTADGSPLAAASRVREARITEVVPQRIARSPRRSRRRSRRTRSAHPLPRVAGF